MIRGSRWSARRKGFASLWALAALVLITCALSAHNRILYNMYKLKHDLEKLDQQVWIEAMVMQRVKYAEDSLDYDESMLFYDGVTIEIYYDFEDVTVIYSFEDRVLERHYRYYLASGTLKILDDSEFYN